MKKQARRTGVQRIAAERKRQIAKLGWSAEHDDMHDGSELAWAAICYAAPDQVFIKDARHAYVRFYDPFPWDSGDDARSDPPTGFVTKARTQEAHRLRLLEKAGALIAAEIDRLLRVEQKRGRE